MHKSLSQKGISHSTKLPLLKEFWHIFGIASRNSGVFSLMYSQSGNIFILYTAYCGSAGKESACNAGDLGSLPGFGRSPAEWKGYPVFWPGEFLGLYSPWGSKESDTTEWLSHFHFHTAYTSILIH